jgi:hypothetical protein
MSLSAALNLQLSTQNFRKSWALPPEDKSNHAGPDWLQVLLDSVSARAACAFVKKEDSTAPKKT